MENRMIFFSLFPVSADGEITIPPDGMQAEINADATSLFMEKLETKK